MRLPRTRCIAGQPGRTRGKTPEPGCHFPSLDRTGMNDLTTHRAQYSSPLFAAFTLRHGSGLLPASAYPPGPLRSREIPGPAPIARGTIARPVTTAPRGGTVSSAILYVAIVAIWIRVLVPRWLRHEHAHDGHLRLRRFSWAAASGPVTRRRELVSARMDTPGTPVSAVTCRPIGRRRAPIGRKSPVTGPRSHNLLSQNYNSPYVSAPVSRNTGAGTAV